MTDTIHIIPAVVLSKLKKRAKAMQRATQQPHHEVLDQLARSMRLPTWHHLTLHANETALAEEAFRRGIVVGIDLKEAMDTGEGDENFRADDRLTYFCRDSVIDYLLKSRQREAERDGILAQYDEEAEKREAAEFADVQTVYYRYVGRKEIKTVKQAIAMAADTNYFAPDWVWFKGKLHAVFGDDDDDA